MAKQLNVNLGFTADVSKAKAQIQELQAALDKVAAMPGKATTLFDDREIREASQAALELQQHLSAAVNINTGKLDLSRFSTSLKSAGKDLNTYSQQLLKIGPTGQQAFLSLARSIATADAPLTRVNKKLAEFGTTLKNTARWQISSSILHGFMGTLQSAYGYAQDLNRSLNDIRIVTGQSTEDMAKFAETANRAAKALSTTTNEYTKASLIYFQQGLSEAEVQKRTEVTIKMANASGQSAQVVSDQMTAIWNNFAKGSDDLIHFADVLTALGAATASSSEEIASGLEKFAAIGETVGLSYEYAASALATITSNTRESAEVVGTALKTIFARMQGLKMGETLEDGLDLNKYSAALKAIGVDVLDATGNLKRADIILEETADKWKNLSTAQQTALAQTVAGVRQYNQFMSLMNNWDDGTSDSMTANLATSASSDGTLQKQADIYAESWEAAQDRVKAAAEDIYDSLINDEFFIDLLNGFEKVLDTLGGFIDGLGGLQGVFTTIGSLFLVHFAQRMPETLNNLRQNLMVFTGQANKEMVRVQTELASTIEQEKASPGATDSYRIELDGIEKVNLMKQKLILASKDLTTQERQEYELKIQNVQKMYDEVAALAKKKEALDDVAKATEKAMFDSGKKGVITVAQEYSKAEDDVSYHEQALQSLDDEADEIYRTSTPATAEADLSRLGTIEQEKQAHMAALEEARQKAVELEAELDKIVESYGLAKGSLEELVTSNGKLDVKAYTTLSNKVKEIGNNFKSVITQRENLNSLGTSVKGQATAWKNAGQAIKNYVATTKNTKKATQDINNMKAKMEAYVKKVQELGKANGLDESVKDITELKKAINGMNLNNIDEVTQQFSEFATAVDTEAGGKITELDMQIDELKMSMQDMQFDPQVVNDMENASNAAADVGVQLQNAKDNVDGMAGEMNELPKGTFQASVAATQFSGALMSAYTVVNSIKGAIDVFGDENSTAFEKVGAAVAVLTSGIAAFNAVQTLSTTLTKSDTIAKAANAVGMKIMSLLTGGVAVAKTAESGAVWANTAAWYANPIMWIALIVVGVVAALVGLIAIIGAVSSALSDAYNADAIAAENAEKAAENLSAAYEDAKTAYEDMISAMDNYESAREGLAELTKGTIEYEEALQKANAAALELIENYPEYFGEGTYEWVDGELIIDEAAMENAKRQEIENVNNAQAAASVGKARAKEARAIANQTDLTRKMKDDNGLGGWDLFWKSMGAGVGMAASATVGSLGMSTALFNPALGAAGMAVGAEGMQQSADYIAGEFEQAAAMEDAIQSVIDLYADDQNLFKNEDYFIESLNKVGITNTELIDALWADKEALEANAQEFTSASKAMELAAQSATQAIVQTNQEAVDSGYANEIALAAAKGYQKTNDEQYDEVYKDITSRGWFNTGTDEAKAIMAEYASITGLDEDSNYEVTNYVGDGTVKINKTDENGDVQEITLTAEEIAATVAADRTGAAAEESIKKITDDFVRLGEQSEVNGKKEGEALISFLSEGNMESASKNEFDAMQSMLASGDTKSIAKQLDSMLQGTYADYGFDSWEDMAKSLQKSAQETQEAWNNIELPPELLEIGDLSLEGAQKLEKQFEEIGNGGLGEEGAKKYTEGLEMITSSMNEADKAKFLEQVANVDWSNWYAIEDVSSIVEGLGYDLDLTDPKIQEFAASMRMAGGAELADRFNRLRDNIAGVSKAFEDGLVPNEEVDTSTYETLIGMNEKLRDSFIKTAEGYRYIGDETLDYQSMGIANELNKMRETEGIYQNAKLALKDSGVDFGKMASFSLTDTSSYEKAVTDAKSKVTSAKKNVSDEEAKDDDWNMFTWSDDDKLKKYKQDVKDAEQGQRDAEEALANAKKHNEDVKKQTKSMIQAIGSDKDLMAAAEAAGYSAEQLAAISNAVSDGDITEEDIAKVNELGEAMNTFMTNGDAGAYDSKDLEEQLASTAKSVGELDSMFQGGLVGVEAYTKAWKGLAQAEKFKGLDTKAVNDYGKHLQKVARNSDLLSDNLSNNAEVANDVAAEVMRLNNGVDKLSDNFEGWNDVLTKSDASSQEYCEAMAGMKDAMSDLLGVNEEYISDSFISDNLDLIAQAAQGSAEAIDELAIAASKDILSGIMDANNVLGVNYEYLQNEFDTMVSQIDIPNVQVGAELNDEDFLQTAQNIINTAGMTVEQANTMFDALGFKATFKTEEKEVEQKVPRIVTRTYTSKGTDDQGREYTDTTQSSFQDGYDTFTGVQEVFAMATGTDTPIIESITRTSSGAMNNSSSSNRGSGNKDKGGGGNKKTEKPKTLDKTEHKNKDDEIERYSEITETIDDLTRAYDEAGAAKDDLWGPDRLKAMEAEGKALGNLITAHKKYQKEISTNLEKDKRAASAVGATFDEAGRINNYDELMGAAVDTWNANTDSLDTRAQQLENERARIANMEDGATKDAAQEKYDADMDKLEKDREANDKAFEDTKEALSTYTDTLNLSEEAAAQLQEYIRQMQQIEYEKTMYKVEFQVEIDERALKVIEYKLKRLEDDFFKSAEAMAMIQGKTNYFDEDQYQKIANGVNELETKFKEGKITQAQYIEGLGQFQDMAMENAEALYEMNDAMKAYYSDTLDAGMQKIQEMTQHFDNLVSRLQHYQSILNLMGHEQNYDLQNKLLQGQIDTLNDRIDVSKSTIEMLDGQLKQAQANYANATTEEEKQQWQQRIMDINNALMEEEDAYLSYVEQVGEAANQILANEIEKAFKEVEDQMTDNMGFDSILNDMERMNTLTDEYLTNTNKMYETNKLIAGAQQAIDKTTNLQAKQQYQHYIEYIEQLQTAGNLTQTELEVAQARYKVLEAEMALEEAKEAKSTVRLSRDAEGNFGYVYTADQGTVDNAQQNYLDAQNELYNIGLETTNEYREKIIELQQQTLEDLKQLEIDYRVNHLISEEEYEQQKAAIMETSQATLQTYQEQFNLGQYTMASTQYSTLMAEDKNFYNGQLSTQKENLDIMAIKDVEYYNGVKTTAEETHKNLNEKFKNFGVDTLNLTDEQYKLIGDKDVRYYSTLKDINNGTLDEVYKKYKEGSEKVPEYSDKAAEGVKLAFTGAARGVNLALNTGEDSAWSAIMDFYKNVNGEEGFGAILAATEAWKTNMQPLVEAVGVDFDGNETEEGLSQKIKHTKEESEKLNEYMTKKPGGLIDSIGKELTEVQSATTAWEAHWKTLETVIGYYDTLIGKIQTTITEMGKMPDTEGDTTPPEDPTPPAEPTPTPDPTPAPNPTPPVSATPENTTAITEPTISTGQKVTVKGSATTFTRDGGNGTKMQKWIPGNQFVIKKISGDEVLIGDPCGPNNYASGYTGWVSKYDLEGFFTGGYTGEWGPEGKLAMLHEKELVLNKQDTENFLTATSMLREISQLLDNNALVASLGAINLAAMTINSQADKVLQQEVTIHAEFPNVSDHSEIELAIDNLINAASQHAFKS